MKRWRTWIRLLAIMSSLGATALGSGLGARHPRQAGEPRIERVPGGGIEPQAEVGPRGTLRMIYFTGSATAGNIEYVQRRPGAKSFSRPPYAGLALRLYRSLPKAVWEIASPAL